MNCWEFFNVILTPHCIFNFDKYYQTISVIVFVVDIYNKSYFIIYLSITFSHFTYYNKQH